MVDGQLSRAVRESRGCEMAIIHSFLFVWKVQSINSRGTFDFYVEHGARISRVCKKQYLLYYLQAQV